jgi:hypothetical protein
MLCESTNTHAHWWYTWWLAHGSKGGEVWVEKEDFRHDRTLQLGSDASATCIRCYWNIDWTLVQHTTGHACVTVHRQATHTVGWPDAGWVWSVVIRRVRSPKYLSRSHKTLMQQWLDTTTTKTGRYYNERTIGCHGRIQTSLRPDATTTMTGRYCNSDRTLLQLASQAIATMHQTHPIISTSESGHCVGSPLLCLMALFCLGVFK